LKAGPENEKEKASIKTIKLPLLYEGGALLVIE
jgi:hypothetical protein